MATYIPKYVSERDNDSNRSRNRTIELAAVVDDPSINEKKNYRVIGALRIATNLSVSALCIAIKPMSQSEPFVKQPQSILVALDSSGILHTCSINNFNSSHDGDNDFLDMRECRFNLTHEGKQSNTSVYPDLRMMNTLTARLESDSIIFDSSSSSSQIISTPRTKISSTKNARKRKLSLTAEDSVTSSERIYLVASNLTASILPSQSPPIVMLLSSSMSESDSSIIPEEVNSPYSGLAWSIISGLEHVHVPLSCILYVSRSRCGAHIWAGILAAMMNTANTETMESQITAKEECNEGVVLMGFHDGTLRASLIATNETMSNIQLDSGHATTLFQLSSREPIKSIQLLSPNSRVTSTDTPILLCVGALGAIITLSPTSLKQPRRTAGTPKFRIHEPLELCGGCWISISCIRHYFLDEEEEDHCNSDGSIPPFGLTIIGISDLKQTFLHHLIIQNDSSNKEKANHSIDGLMTVRLPVPTRLSSSVHASPHLVASKCSSTNCTFSLASSRGSLVMMRLSMSKLTSMHQTLSRGNGGHQLFATEMTGANAKQYITTNEINHKRDLNSGPLSAHSLLQRIDAATAKRNKVKARLLFDSTTRQSKVALQEIREVSRAAALINKSPFSGISSPIELKVKQTNNGVAKCSVSSNDLPLTKQPSTGVWLPTIHILQSCIQTLSSSLRPISLMKNPPICYRRNLKRDGKLIPILYGGTAHSYNGCHGSGESNEQFDRISNIDVSLNDFVPVHVYGSMSMIYTDSVPSFVKDQHDDTWHRSEVHASIDGRKEHRANACYPELVNSAGLAKNSISRFLGASLPFDIATQTPFILDILTHFSTYNGQHFGQAESKAERHVIHRYQNHSTQQSSQRKYVVPWLKERQLILFHSAQMVDNKFYCSSRLIHCRRTRSEHCSPTYVDAKELCVNTGCSGTTIMAITHTPKKSDSFPTTDNDVGILEIAIGSNVMNPDESLSFIPLVRQAIIRRGIARNLTAKDDTNLHKLYHKLLTEKRTAKLTKHIEKIADELIANTDKTSGQRCSTELLAATISLYDILRAMNITFYMS